MAKLKNNQTDNIDFLNPYTFVPFQKVPPKPEAWEQKYSSPEDLLTGWLDIELIPKTPIIIPDTAHREEIKVKNKKGADTVHNKYPFLRLPDTDGVPGIPGGSLRGMLRSVYETLTGSCVSSLMDEKPISQRNPLYAGFDKRGLLHYDLATDTWTLHRAVVYRQKCGKRQVECGKYKGFCTGEKVYFTYDQHRLLNIGRTVQDVSGKNDISFSYDVGWLQFNIPIQQDYSVTVLQPGSVVHTWKGEEYSPDRKLLSALSRDGVVDNSSESPKPMKDLKNKLMEAKNGGDNYVPVYYLTFENKRGTEVYLSGSSIGRVGRNRKWKEIMGSYAPCEKIDFLCPACLLFGTKADGGVRGRLRFTDAVPMNPEKIKSELHTLQILSTPRPSSFEFYLNKPAADAAYWNFDYYSVTVYEDGKGHPEFYPVETMMPRGRKYYWHHREAAEDAVIRSNQNATMEAVSGENFKFRMYFDGIQPQQLSDMIWTITFGENSADSTRLHKIGHAKPLGYGSVKLLITNGAIRKVKKTKTGLSAELVPLNIDVNKAGGTNCGITMGESGISLNAELKADESRKKIMNNILKICDADVSENLNIRYPVKVTKKGEEEIFEWFSKNRNVNKHHISPDTLPNPTDKKLTLRGTVLSSDSAQGKKNADSTDGEGKYADKANQGNKMGESRKVKAVVLRINAKGNCRLKLQGKESEGQFNTRGKSYSSGSEIDVYITGYSDKYDVYWVKPLE